MANAASNNQAIAQAQALIAAAQNAANSGDYATAAAIAAQAQAATAGITSSGAQAAVGAALAAAQANIANPQQNVASGGNAGYQAVQQVIAQNPPKTPSAPAAAAQAANANIGQAQGLTAAAQVAANTGNSALAQSLYNQAQQSISTITNTRAQKAIQEALSRVTIPEPETEKEEDPKPPTSTGSAISPSNIRASYPTVPVQERQSIVKSPNKDVFNWQKEQYSASSIARLLFEQVGSIELINIARRDTIEGQNPYYSVISNLASIKKNFNPTTLISRQRVNETVFDNYTIDLNSKIPDQEYLDNNNIESFYYIDTNGDLVIELDNLADDERIELEIAESGTINLVDEI